MGLYWDLPEGGYDDNGVFRRGTPKSNPPGPVTVEEQKRLAIERVRAAVAACQNKPATATAKPTAQVSQQSNKSSYTPKWALEARDSKPEPKAQVRPTVSLKSTQTPASTPKPNVPDRATVIQTTPVPKPVTVVVDSRPIPRPRPVSVNPFGDTVPENIARALNKETAPSTVEEADIPVMSLPVTDEVPPADTTPEVEPAQDHQDPGDETVIVEETVTVEVVDDDDKWAEQIRSVFDISEADSKRMMEICDKVNPLVAKGMDIDEICEKLSEYDTREIDYVFAMVRHTQVFMEEQKIASGDLSSITADDVVAAVTNPPEPPEPAAPKRKRNSKAKKAEEKPAASEEVAEKQEEVVIEASQEESAPEPDTEEQQQEQDAEQQ